MKKGFFISGTDTNVGKTILSAILVNKLNAIYWKPIQCGLNKFGEKDSDVIKKLCMKKFIISEKFFLKAPLSPNIASKMQNIKILKKDFIDFRKKKFSKQLIVEGAGGLQVPINNNFFVSDLAKFLNLPVILVCRTKLGTINHTLMSLEILKKKKINFYGLVFVGKSQPHTIKTIKEFGEKILKKKIKIVALLPNFKDIDKKKVSYYSEKIKL